MDVIGHPDEGKDLPTRATDGLFEPIGHPLVVTIFVEQQLSAIAPRHHVVNRPGELDS